MAYKLEIPITWRVHPVFHVSLLKESKTDSRYSPPPPNVEYVDGEARYVIEAITGERMLRGKQQYLVKWLGYTEETYEYEKPLRMDTDHASKCIEKYLTAKQARLNHKGSA